MISKNFQSNQIGSLTMREGSIQRTIQVSEEILAQFVFERSRVRVVSNLRGAKVERGGRTGETREAGILFPGGGGIDSSII